MMLKRYHTIYPQNIFRAQIIFKNVAPSEDKWAEGVLCRDIDGRFSIVNKKVGQKSIQVLFGEASHRLF